MPARRLNIQAARLVYDNLYGIAWRRSFTAGLVQGLKGQTWRQKTGISGFLA
jgi:hypothetical protein